MILHVFTVHNVKKEDIWPFFGILKAVPKLAPPEPPNRGGGGPHKKEGPVNSQYVVLFNQRMIKVP